MVKCGILSNNRRSKLHAVIDCLFLMFCFFFHFFFIKSGFLFAQIIMVQFFNTAFHVTGMDWDQWMWCLFLGFSELLWAQLIFTIPKDVLPAWMRCAADGAPQGRGIAYMRSCSRMEQTV